MKLFKRLLRKLFRKERPKWDAESEERLRLILTAGGPVCFSKDEAETLDWLAKNYPVVFKLLCYAAKNTKS